MRGEPIPDENSALAGLLTELDNDQTSGRIELLPELRSG